MDWSIYPNSLGLRRWDMTKPRDFLKDSEQITPFRSFSWNQYNNQTKTG